MSILQSASTEQTIINSYTSACITATLYLTAFLSDTSPLQTTRAASMAQTKRCLKNLKKWVYSNQLARSKRSSAAIRQLVLPPHPYANDIL